MMSIDSEINVNLRYIFFKFRSKYLIKYSVQMFVFFKLYLIFLIVFKAVVGREKRLVN